ncbi:2-dehydropantoate 2-reductase [Corynebacterium sp. A21]|uniref:2-dehydropantoate 2-reductase n=1 Tax=Corynebacterium sp. A21 TaxID=3457318 RepID=UPI003FD522AA
MRIGIIGAGAVGGYFGGRLALAGKDITFLARGETLEVLREKGLTLIDAAGTTTVQVPAVASFTEVGGVDVVIVATKALPSADTFPGVPAGTPIVTTQNSVEAPYLAADRFGADNVLPGVVRGFMIHQGPAVVEFRGGPLSLNLGSFDGRDGELGVLGRQLAADLSEAGIPSTWFSDIWLDVWGKAMFVAPFGALGAAAEQPLGYLRTELRSSLEKLVREVAAVARAHGVALPADAVPKIMDFADAMDPAATSSMQRDVLAGAENELDAQVGAIRRMGAQVGVDTALHDLLHGILDAR